MGMWEYPSQLNFSALRFERCEECHEPRTVPPSSPSRRSPGPLRSVSPCCVSKEGDAAAGGYGREKSDKRMRQTKTKKSKKTSRGKNESGKCLNSILGDDLILCRLSALLAPLFGRVQHKPALVRRVSSSDIDDIGSDCRSGGSLRSRAPAFALIPGDEAVVLPPTLPASQQRDGDGRSPIQQLLSTVGIEEVEALDPSNGGPSAGQCQFACIASALSKSFGLDRPLRDGYRPDLELRSLALHTVRMNPDMYRDFMTVAGGRTRKQNAAGGSSVDLDGYLRSMSSPSCDGDAVTLQALCDALKITIRIVKTVDADWYDEGRQRERLLGCAALSSSRLSLGGESNDGEDDAASSTTSVSSVESSFSSLSWSHNPYSSFGCLDEVNEADDGGSNGAQCRLQRLYVSQEIHPRQLPCVDSRIRDVQNVARGRLIWLSHIGDEAHYRFLRPLTAPAPEREDSTGRKSHPLFRPPTCPQGPEPCNEEEAQIARFSRMRRHRFLLNSCALQDGYARLYRGEAQTILRKGLDSVAKAALVRRCAHDQSVAPRCGLCLEAFFVAGSNDSKSPVSPSCCHHDYCQDCIMSWSQRVGNNCPSCGCFFMALVDSLSGRVLHSLATDCVSSSGTVFDLDAVACESDKLEDDDSSISSCEENGSSDDEVEEKQSSSSPSAQSLSAILADLDATFSKAAAGTPRRQVEGGADDDSPSSLVLDLFSEISRNRRADACQINDILEDLLGSLSQGDADVFANEVIDAGLLRAIRLLLSPSRVSSSLRDTTVHVGDATRHVVDPSLFLKCISVLERVTTRRGQDVLTWGIMQNCFDLPKLLLWYSTFNPYSVASHHKAVDRTCQILMHWSKHFGFSLVDAVHESKARPASIGKKAMVQAKSARSPKKATGAQSSPRASRKRSQAESPTVAAGETRTRAKRARHTMSAEDKKVIRAILKEETQLNGLVRRAAGKRKVRPVTSFNVEIW
eukprot:CAMPEP_0197433796 /NCGR_PEP_ID=MMETSP1175-20131217/1599_1 /TAXON_ID=1003142 /ORGANISM="Triceratium dubium, Strain CCMP147" /LENGTH=968 /DNA_ID=CAMNT_0042962281 /DNA_START=151 /DNA_END=3060 /DNA_ORIENTATION=+